MNDEAEDIISALEATHRWLGDALTVAGKGLVEAPRGGGEWGLADSIGHLRASDAILAPRVLHVLIRPGAPLAAFDERAWAGLAAAAGVSIAEQLTEFALRRRELVGVLRSLNQEQWTLAGEHELRGTMTVAQIAASIVEHEAEHRVQIGSLLAASS
ncbi:MAG: DinB family protein [Chloroflexota bacterium]|nr:DinB family protein [Chloroflexota bacterium]